MYLIIFQCHQIVDHIVSSRAMKQVLGPFPDYVSAQDLLRERGFCQANNNRYMRWDRGLMECEWEIIEKNETLLEFTEANIVQMETFTPPAHP